MSCKNFGGRGRGFAPRGGFRPRFPGPPFRHAGPPRPGCPPPGVPPFGMPWRPNARFFPPHMLRGNPQFRPVGGRKKRFYSYDVRFPAPNMLPPPPEYEEGVGYEQQHIEVVPPYWQAPPNLQAPECNQVEAGPPQPPPLGSEEERQQKIAETADRLKQKLSSFNKSEMTNIWADDMSINTEDNTCAENTNIPLHRYEPSELSLTNSDLKDIGKINPATTDNLQYDDAQHLTDVFDVDVNRDVTLDENNDGSQVEMFDGTHQVATNLVNLHSTDEYVMEMNEGEQLIDTGLEQLDYANQDIHIESESLELNVPCYNIPLANMSPDQYEQQPQDMSQETLLPFDTANQEILHDCQEEPVANLEFQEDVPTYDDCALLQPAPTIGASIPVLNNGATDDQSPQESFLRGGPPELSPHIEQELPIDFDPTTPPPMLLKQDQSYAALPPPALPPPALLSDLPLFNPAEPPPNMRHLESNVVPPHESANSTWSNPLPPVAAAAAVVPYGGMEMHGGFVPQQLPLDLPGQSNIFMPPPIETINYVAPFVPACNNAAIVASIPPVLPLQMPPMVPPKTFAPSPPPEPPPPPPPPTSDEYCNKDEMLNDLQEAMKFAMEMTEITERQDGMSNEDSAATDDLVGDVNSIALPPGMPTPKTGKKKEKKKQKNSTHNKQLVFVEQGTSSYIPPLEDTVAAQQDAYAMASAIEQDRPKVVFNLNNKTKMVNVEWTDTVISETSKIEKKNGMVQSDAKKAAPLAVKKNLENTSRSREEERTLMRSREEERTLTRSREEERILTRSREEERMSRRSEGNLERTIPIESSRNQKKAPREDGVQASERLHYSVVPRVNLQKSRSRTTRSESSSSSSSTYEASWKNKIISRFLKMSKNDIYNMVNNTSLRKFDIIMKRLVKEKKHTLSLEMRHAQDEKMKLYDQQEFMKQLNDMLDSDTIESITDLPTEFIHHLNEVLQLDMQFDDEFMATTSGHAEQLAIYTPVAECASAGMSVAPASSVDQESMRSKSHDSSTMVYGGATKTRHDKDVAPACSVDQESVWSKSHDRSAMVHGVATKARHDKDAVLLCGVDQESARNKSHEKSAMVHGVATKARHDKNVALPCSVDQESARSKSHERSAMVHGGAMKARHDKDVALPCGVDQESARSKSHERSAMMHGGAMKARHEKDVALPCGVNQESARSKSHERSAMVHGGATKARHDKDATLPCGVDQESARSKSHERSAMMYGGAMKARHDKDAALPCGVDQESARSKSHERNAMMYGGAMKARHDKDAALPCGADQEYARNKSHERSAMMHGSAMKARHDKDTAPMCSVDQEFARSKIHERSAMVHGVATKARHDKDVASSACSVKSELNALRGDAVFSVAACESPNTKLLTLQHAVDDIFSEVTKKIQKEVPAATKERKNLAAPQRGAKKPVNELSASQKNTPPPAVEDDRMRRWEISARWLENKWKKKEREDPRAYRNLTKEEWEAKYGTQASSLALTTVSSPAPQVAKKVDTIAAAAAAAAVAGEQGTCRARARIRKILPRRRHSSESSRQSNTRRSRPLEKDKHKESRRHSDDRQHTAGYTAEAVVARLARDSKSKSSSRQSSTSSTSKSSTSSSDSDSNDNDRDDDRDNVTKLLREIKEKEKVAKQMSLNETIRDEVNAEIERERKQKSKRKGRKNSKNRKEKRMHHKKKKKKKSKKTVSSSEFESNNDESDEDGALPNRLLTESEIKKEDEVVQQVIIKEELDIGQDTIVGGVELAASISGCALAARVPREPPETPTPPPSLPPPPPPPSQESTSSVVSSAQPHAEEKMPPTASPTQPKTKAQLKQMPEAAADLNDNQVNVFTSLPKDWRETIHPAIIAAACAESNSCDSVTDGAKNGGKTEKASLPAAAEDFDAPSGGESTECATPQRGQIPLIASQPSGTINTRRDNETPVSNDVSNKASTVSAASATAAADGSPAVPKQQGGSKKIDIKTYYERRMNGQGELKRVAESPPAAPPVEVSPAKIARRESTTERPVVAFADAKIDASRSSSTIRDPRLISQSQKLAAAHTAATAATASEDKQTAKESRAEVATSKPRFPPVKSDANTASTSVATPSASPKLGESPVAPSTTTRRKLQRNFPPDSKRFQNIRSEGSKELKLKKESGSGGAATAKKPRPKRKPVPESTGLVSPSQTTTICCPSKEPATNVKNAERRGSGDSIASSSEADAERTAPRDDKADNSGNAGVRLPVISLRRITDNDGPPRDKPREHAASPSKSAEISTAEEAEKEEATASKKVESVAEAEACVAERANDETSVVVVDGGVAATDKKAEEEEENATSEISHVAAPELDGAPPITSEITEISRESIVPEESPSASTPIVAPCVDVVAPDSIALNEEHAVSAIPELNLSGVVDDIVTDAQGKADQLLIISACIVSRDLEIGATKGNDMKADASSDGGASCGGRASVGDSDPLRSSEITPSAAASRVPATTATTVSSESTEERQGNDVVSPGSVGSPFKGFLQEAAAAATVDFAQPGLFSFELTDLVDDGKNRDPLDHCSLLDCTTATTGHKVVEMRIDGLRPDPEMLVDVVDPSSVSMDEHGFGVLTFDDTLLASDKEGERSDRSAGLTADGEETARAIVAASDVVDDDNNDGAGGGGRAMSEVRRYVSDLASMKESMFINEEEIIQDEARHMRDLTSKLKTTADPSLTDAIDHATSDDALRLPVGQVGAEPLNNHLYLEAQVSPGTGKEPDYDDEHLDENMFYLDERLQSSAAFEVAHKVDDTSVVVGHFSGSQGSPTYEIASQVTPETTMLIADLGGKEERCEFDFTKHIPPAGAGDMLAETPTIECASPLSSRTLNVPTKAALKEAARNLFLKSAPDGATATASEASHSAALSGLFGKTPHSGADLNYQTMAWNINTPANLQSDTCGAREFVNTNSGGGTAAAKEIDGQCRGDLGGEYTRHKSASASSSRHIENVFSNNARPNSDMELQNMKESTIATGTVERKAQKSSEKIRDAGVASGKDRRRRKDRNALHNLKDKRQMKRSRDGNSDLAKKMKGLKQSGVPSTRDGILARMLEIDIEIHKLMNEKLELHERLQRTPPAVSGTVGAALSKLAEENVVGPALSSPPPSLQPSTLLSMLSQNVTPDESNRAKQQRDNKHRPSTPKHFPVKQRKRIPSHSSEDEEIMRSTQKKMPVIKWKKPPRLEMSRRGEEEDDDEEEEEGENDRRDARTISSGKKADGSMGKTVVRKSESDLRAHKDAAKKIGAGKSKRGVCADSSKRQDSSIERESNERVEHTDFDKRNDASTTAPSEATATATTATTATKVNSQTLSAPVHSTPEPLSIYSDDSTWDSLVQNTASEMHERRKVTGLALLDEKLKQQQARARKITTIVRKRKKQQLNSFLKSVNKLTRDEEDLPLSKLYIKKLRQQRDLLVTLSQKKKEATSPVVEPEILKNMEEVINAVAENRVENLYEPPSEERTPPTLDVPTTSNAIVPQVASEDKHQFYVDVEANANSDWPCREKEDIVGVAVTASPQQDNDDAPGDVDDSSNHVFKAVNQDKSIYSERDAESASSAIPSAETLIEKSCASDYRSLQLPKDPNNVMPRIFDIKVSVPKIVIKDGEFDRSLLLPSKDKDKDKESGAVDTGPVESVTLPSVETLEKEHSDAPSVSQQILEPTEQPEEVDPTQEDKKEEESEKVELEKDKHVIKEEVTEEAIGNEEDANKPQEPEKTDDATDEPQSAAQLDVAKSSAYSDITENEDTRDSVASNDKTAVEEPAHDADSVVQEASKKMDTTTEKRPDDAEVVQLSSDTIASQPDDQHAKSLTPVREEQKTDAAEVTQQIVFEKIVDSEHSTIFSSVPPSEKSEESNEQRSDLEHTSTTVFPFNRTIDRKSAKEAIKRSRRRYEQAPVRRSTRYSNENVKPRMNDVNDSNSNSSEQESSVLERDASAHGQDGKSPSWAMRDEKSNVLMNNVRKNRAAQKEQSAHKVTVAEVETRAEENPIRSNFTAIAAEPTAVGGRKRKAPHTEWQIRNCKVRLIDCKHTFLKQNVGADVLSKFGIVAVNRPHVSSDISHAHHVARNPDIPSPVNPAAVASFPPAETSYNKDKFEVEILEAKMISEKISDPVDIVPESTSDATETTTDNEWRTQYTVHKGPILDIKIHKHSFLAASEDGKIYRYSQTSNGILNIYKGHKSAVTCLYVYKSDVGGIKMDFMFSGSLDGTLRCYNITTGALMKTPAHINSPIQCMDQAWGIIFVGTKSGHVSRFHIKPGVIKGGSIEFSQTSVLALKATNEGPRRILIVASRNLPITIRDAQTGLFLRTICSQNNHTVYSLMRHHNLIYCGTSSTSINVFDFTTGEQTIQYDAGVGIVCMRLCGQLLFAGCYDGNIYVFDTRNHKLVCSIPGPGNMLLSIEVVNNKIIAGSKDKRLHSWQMPIQVRALL